MFDYSLIYLEGNFMSILNSIKKKLKAFKRCLTKTKLKIKRKVRAIEILSFLDKWVVLGIKFIKYKYFKFLVATGIIVLIVTYIAERFFSTAVLIATVSIMTPTVKYLWVFYLNSQKEKEKKNAVQKAELDIHFEYCIDHTHELKWSVSTGDEAFFKLNHGQLAKAIDKLACKKALDISTAHLLIITIKKLDMHSSTIHRDLNTISDLLISAIMKNSVNSKNKG